MASRTYAEATRSNIASANGSVGGGELAQAFRQKAAFVKTWRPASQPSNRDRLELYAWHMQAVLGDAPTASELNSAPEGKAKYAAWRAKAGTSAASAMRSYLQESERQVRVYGMAAPTSPTSPAAQLENHPSGTSMVSADPVPETIVATATSTNHDDSGERTLSETSAAAAAAAAAETTPNESADPEPERISTTSTPSKPGGSAPKPETTAQTDRAVAALMSQEGEIRAPEPETISNNAAAGSAAMRDPETISPTATAGSASTVLSKTRATLDDDGDKAAAAARTKPMAAPEERMNSANSTTVHGRVSSTVSTKAKDAGANGVNKSRNAVGIDVRLGTASATATEAFGAVEAAHRTEDGSSTADNETRESDGSPNGDQDKVVTEPLPTDCERVLDEKHGSAAKRETASDVQDESCLSLSTSKVSEAREGSLLPVVCETETTTVAQTQSGIQPGNAAESEQGGPSPTRTDDEPGQQDETGRGTKRDRSSYENRPDPASEEKEPPLEQEQQQQQKYAAQSASPPKKKKKTKTSLSSFAQDPQSTAKNPPAASHDSAAQAMQQEQSTTLGGLQNEPEAAALRHWNEMVALIELLRAGSLEELPAQLHQSMLKTSIAQMNLENDERRGLRNTAYYALFSEAAKVKGQREFKARLRRALVASLFEEGDGKSNVRIRAIMQKERKSGYFKDDRALTSDTYHEFLRNYLPIRYPMKAESQATLEVLPRTSGPVETKRSVLGETTSFPNSHALNKDDSPSNEPNGEKEVLDSEQAQLARVYMEQAREIRSPKHQLATQHHHAPVPPPESISERSVTELLQQDFHQIDQEEDVRIRQHLGNLTALLEADLSRIGKNIGAPVTQRSMLGVKIQQLSSYLPQSFVNAIWNLNNLRIGLHFDRNTPTRGGLKHALVRYLRERDNFEQSNFNGAPDQPSPGRSPGDQSSARSSRRSSSSFRAPAQSPERRLGGHLPGRSQQGRQDRDYYSKAPVQTPERRLDGHLPGRSQQGRQDRDYNDYSYYSGAPAQYPERRLDGYSPGRSQQGRQDRDYDNYSYYSGALAQYPERRLDGYSLGRLRASFDGQGSDYNSGALAQYPQHQPSGHPSGRSSPSFSGDNHGRRDRQHQDDRRGVRQGDNHFYQDENRHH